MHKIPRAGWGLAGKAEVERASSALGRVWELCRRSHIRQILADGGISFGPQAAGRSAAVFREFPSGNVPSTPNRVLTGNTVRAAIITQDDPFAVPVLLEELFRRRADAIVALYIARSPGGEGLVATLRRWWSLLGPVAFFRYGVVYAWARLLGRGPAQMALRRGIPVAEVGDVNAPDFLDALNALEPDLVISVACPQIFGSRLLKLPRHGCINVHSGPLPRYRGQLPTFWVLYHGERQTAVTVHQMNRKVDDGPILLQESVPIDPGETQACLMRRCKRVGGRLLAEALALFEAGTPTTSPNPAQEATYFSFPTAADAREFRRRGCRWL